MPTFSFVIQDKPKRNNVKRINKEKIIQKDIECIVHIDIDANYYVIYEGNKYFIDKKCYTCKKYDVLYRQGILDDGRIIKILISNKFETYSPLFYLPFRPGSFVQGDLIKNINNDITFIIDKTYVKYNDNAALDALRFYKRNAEIINNKIKQRQLNGV